MSENSQTSEMKIQIDPARARQLLQNLQEVQSRIAQVLEKSSATSPQPKHLKRTLADPPRLIAVSKLKPASDILALHQPPSDIDTQTIPHLHFGENYVQELLEKSRLLPHTIRWHFIGGLQSNKCAQLAREVSNLWAVESVDSIKKANLLNKGRGEVNEAATTDGDKNPLRIFVQVNTSGEESKSGVEPKSAELLDLCRTIHEVKSCPHLKLQGLMTIGAIARSQETTAKNVNEDFEVLRDSREWVASELGLNGEELELSMGMSEDFEGAIVQGSDEVRVGSTIFGARPPKKEAKVLEDTEGEKK